MPTFEDPVFFADRTGCKKHGVVVGSASSGGKAKLTSTTTVVDEADVHFVRETDVEDFVKCRVEAEQLSDAFFVVDLTKVKRQYQDWRRLLPRVEAFYAVKCNPDGAVIRQLASLGSGFDCASEREIKRVMREGVPASSIIFANPCKQKKEIAAARRLGIRWTTFDTEYELEKLKQHAPDAQTLIRIRSDDPKALFCFGGKFGAEMTEVPGLYGKAKSLGISVVGVCFHIGSGASDAAAFSDAIALARRAFDLGRQHGFDMSVLDIGGGFSSRDTSKFESMAAAVNASLDLHFPLESGVRVIAEPGRYLMETCAVLACNIFGVRERVIDGVSTRDYWITDGIHGSFSPLTVGFTEIKAQPLKLNGRLGDQSFSSTIFGPTCNGNDHVLKDIQLPALFPDDWLLFHDMGAYTSALSSNFNGLHGDVDVVYITIDGSYST